MRNYSLHQLLVIIVLAIVGIASAPASRAAPAHHPVIINNDAGFYSVVVTAGQTLKLAVRPTINVGTGPKDYYWDIWYGKISDSFVYTAPMTVPYGNIDMISGRSHDGGGREFSILVTVVPRSERFPLVESNSIWRKVSKAELCDIPEEIRSYSHSKGFALPTVNYTGKTRVYVSIVNTKATGSLYLCYRWGPINALPHLAPSQASGRDQSTLDLDSGWSESKTAESWMKFGSFDEVGFKDKTTTAIRNDNGAPLKPGERRLIGKVRSVIHQRIRFVDHYRAALNRSNWIYERTDYYIQRGLGQEYVPPWLSEFNMSPPNGTFTWNGFGAWPIDQQPEGK